MDIIKIITAYNPLFSPEQENIIMVPLELVDDVKELAKIYDARIQVFNKRKGKFAYIWWQRLNTAGEKHE